MPNSPTATSRPDPRFVSPTPIATQSPSHLYGAPSLFTTPFLLLAYRGVILPPLHITTSYRLMVPKGIHWCGSPRCFVLLVKRLKPSQTMPTLRSIAAAKYARMVLIPPLATGLITPLSTAPTIMSVAPTRG